MSTDTNKEALTVNQMQAAVHEWISQWDEGYWSPLANLARLTEEVGELARELNHTHGEKPKKSSEPDGEIASELADIMFVVVTIANSLDIDLESAFREVMKKYKMRDAGRWTPKES